MARSDARRPQSDCPAPEGHAQEAEEKYGHGPMAALTLVLAEDDDDELDPEQQARLDTFLDTSSTAANRGETVSAWDFMARFEARRRRWRWIRQARLAELLRPTRCV